MHNLGKIMVNATLRGGGFEVIDLGEDVAKERFINTVKEEKPDILGLGCYMTSTMLEMGEIIKELEAEGLRRSVKIMIGGVPCTQEFADEITADAWGKDAFDAVEKAKKLLEG
jgi:methanogenic corrinoid protein MtbC1